MRALVCVAVAGWMAVAAPAVAVSAGEAPPGSVAEIARNVAQNILGADTVKSVQLVDRGTGLAMVWESPTYKPHHSVAYTRELLRAEAQLTLSAIFRALGAVQRVRFEIVLGKRRLARGEAGRQVPLQMTYSTEFGRP